MDFTECKNHLKNAYIKEVRNDWIMTRIKESGTYTPRESTSVGMRASVGNRDAINALQSQKYKIDNVRIVDMKTGKEIITMPTAQAKKLYGVVPTKRKKLRLHLFTMTQYTDYVK